VINYMAIVLCNFVSGDNQSFEVEASYFISDESWIGDTFCGLTLGDGCNNFGSFDVWIDNFYFLERYL
jgi:hypothetical protein